MNRLLLIALILGALTCVCHAEPDIKVRLDVATGGSIIATAGEQKFASLAELEQRLATFQAGSEVKLVYWYGPFLLGKPFPDSKLGSYVAAIKQFCADHHLTLRERAIGT